MSHQVRVVVVMLKVLSRRQGAHGVHGYCSPEFLSASGALSRRWRRGYGSRGNKREARLDAQSHGDDACVKEKERGGQVLTRRVAGVANRRWRYRSSLLSTLQSTRGRANITGRFARMWGSCEGGRGGKGRCLLAGIDGESHRR